MSRRIRASIHAASRRPMSSPSRRRRADLHSGLLLPQQPELGQSGLLSPGRPQPERGGGARIVHFPILRRQDRAALRSLVGRRSRAGADRGSLVDQARAQGRGRDAQAGRNASLSSTRSRMRVKRLDASSPRARARASCWPGLRMSSHWSARRAASRSTTTPISWARTPSARWSSQGRKAS